MTIAKNAGMDATQIVVEVEQKGGDIGYDALNNEYVNMFERGIIDPTKVSNFFNLNPKILSQSCHWSENRKF